MLITYMDKVKKEVSIEPPFVPGDVVQFMDECGKPTLDTVELVVAYGEYTLDFGKAYAKWKIEGKTFKFQVFTPMSKFTCTKEEGELMAKEDARLNQYQLRGFKRSA
jgi:hypothetical protein